MDAQAARFDERNAGDILLVEMIAVGLLRVFFGPLDDMSVALVPLFAFAPWWFLGHVIGVVDGDWFGRRKAGL